MLRSRLLEDCEFSIDLESDNQNLFGGTEVTKFCD